MLERRTAGSLSTALETMRQWLAEPGPLKFARLEIDTPGDADLDLPLWPKVRWASRTGDLDVRGWGAAREWNPEEWSDGVDVPGDLGLGRLSETACALRWFLWGRFDVRQAAGAEWSPYGVRRVVLPLVEWRREGERRFLACNRMPGREAEQAEALENASLRRHGIWRGGAEIAGVSRQQWRAGFDCVQRHLGANARLEKVVLARFSEHEAPRFAPVRFLAALGERQVDVTSFLIEPEPGTAFLGASPERLFRRAGRKFLSEALAGTRPRGDTPEADDRLAAELLESPKDRREQALVQEKIVAALEPLADDVRAEDGPRLKKLRDVQHLCTPIEAQLKTGVGDGALLAALHPTPAVAGQPPQEAVRVISEAEAFSRGFYAGPVGCGSVHETDVAVAIRSALWYGGRVRFYAGAGLLPASRIEDEWDEAGAKMGLMRRLLLDRAEGERHGI